MLTAFRIRSAAATAIGKGAALTLAAAAVFALAGCYSFSGSTLPSHLRTVRIDPVANRTLDPTLPEMVRRSLEDGLRSRSNLRRVNEGGNAELVTVLTGYSQRPQTIDGATVTSFRVDILASVRFIDHVKGDTLYSDDQVPGFGLYEPARGQTDETAKRQAVDGLVKVILDNSISGW